MTYIYSIKLSVLKYISIRPKDFEYVLYSFQNKCSHNSIFCLSRLMQSSLKSIEKDNPYRTIRQMVK